MTDISSLITQIRELLPKVTPGPWQRSGVRQTINENCIMVGPDGFNIVAIPHGRHPKDHAGAFVDAAYIAALNPVTVTALLDRIEELEKAVAYESGDPEAIKGHRALFKRMHDAESRLAEAREDALEAAAKVAEAHVICDWSRLPGKATDDRFGRQIAAAIRTLKSGGENG